VSAALTLTYVWAVESALTRPAYLRPLPLSGAPFYRKRTKALLRKYLRVSMDMGRLPSLLSQKVFRGRATSCRIRNFEDAVVFVIDVERCLKRLDPPSQELVARIALQEYTQAEAAEMTGQSLRSTIRRYSEALDRLTGLFLDAELLAADPFVECQEGSF
jgi:hypothetical protein